jgi:hypothetical protein
VHVVLCEGVRSAHRLQRGVGAVWNRAGAQGYV